VRKKKDRHMLGWKEKVCNTSSRRENLVKDFNMDGDD